MANYLKMAQVHTIITLHQQGWSNRRIAKALGIHRQTVGRYVGSHAGSDPGGCGPPDTSKPSSAPPGWDAVDQPPVDNTAAAAGEVSPSKPSSAPPGSASRCEPWREVIQAKLDVGLSAQRIYQDLTAEHGYRGSYYVV